jgi:hypothetical protein
MDMKKIAKILDAIKDSGYWLVSLDASQMGRISMDIGVPLIENTPADPGIDTSSPGQYRDRAYGGGPGGRPDGAYAQYTKILQDLESIKRALSTLLAEAGDRHFGCYDRNGGSGGWGDLGNGAGGKG